jgi:hypothetical protein
MISSVHFVLRLLIAFRQAVFRSAHIRRKFARSWRGGDSSDEELQRYVHAQTRSHSVKYNKSLPVPIVAVFTKYDVLVESLNPLDEEEFYGDIEKEIENLEKELGSHMDLNTGTSASQIDPHVLPLAEEKLCEMITPSEGTLGVPWVKVSGLDKSPFILSTRSY